MSLYKGNTLIAGNGGITPLLSFVWADHVLNNPSWLQADNFTWNSGTVYSLVYNHLASDISGKTLQSETIGSTTVQYYLADDGHKICPASEESNVSAIYTATGVAWYYIIDTANTRFKLPRTKYGFEGYRTSVGGYVSESLPNITGGVSETHIRNNVGSEGTGYGAIVMGANRYAYTGDTHETSGTGNWSFDASRVSSTYQNNAPVQERATQMYLYFYVGQFTQSALINTAGITSETLALKVDKGHQVIDFQEPTSSNNYTWYRKYADGWVEQGGTITTNLDAAYVQTLPVTMANAGYQVFTSRNTTGDFVTESLNGRWQEVYNVTTTSFTTWGKYLSYTSIFWQVSGMYQQ